MMKFASNLKISLAQSRWFWRVKAAKDRLSFRFAKFVFLRRERFRADRDYAAIGGSIGVQIIGWVAILVVGFVGVEILERVVIKQGWLAAIPIPTPSSYDGTLQTIAGIEGVFLAVYFTAVSVVAGAIYATVPHEVRLLLVRERLGNFFVRLVAGCTAISVLILGYRALGGTTGRMVFMLDWIICIYSIFAILIIVRESITMFDPSKVGAVIFRDVLQAVRSASIQGFAWDEANFQRSYSARAYGSIHILRMVVDICQKEARLGNGPLSSVITSTLEMWKIYTQYKQEIPYDSNWYRPIYRPKDWLLAKDFEVSLAMNTHTILQPEAVKDRGWLEGEIIPIVERGILALLERGDIQAVHVCLGQIVNVVNHLASQLDTSKLDAIQGIAKAAVERSFELSEKTKATKEERDAAEMQEIALADMLGTISIAAILGIGRWASSFDMTRFSETVGKIDWTNSRSAYRSGLPYGALENLEYLQKRLAFEVDVEGRRITPNWYVEEIILLGIMNKLEPCVNSIVKALDEYVLTNVDWLMESKRYRAATALALRGLEYVDKLTVHLGPVKRRVGDITHRAKVSGLKWPEFNFEEYFKAIQNSRKSIFQRLAKALPLHDSVPADSLLPDLFGTSYGYLLEEAFLAVVEDDEALFDELFPIVLVSGLGAYDKLQDKVAGWNAESAFAVRADVLIDLLEIGSYAKFMSEYKNNSKIWDSCVKTWDVYLSKYPNPGEVISFFAKIVEVRKRQFQISPRQTLRMHWEQVLGGRLNAEGALKDGFYRPGVGPPSRHPHSSKLVRHVCTTLGMGINWPGADLFVLTYLAKHPSATHPFPFGDRRNLGRLFEVDSDGNGDDEEDFE
ncbi:hypothetical protein [Singulisphaera sp. PoT]|uniref:hypothetical protein n=1 Tax=Singulisphaera sp. PoT TaxID=3411797 RepID=UPI003BF59E80